MSLDQTPLHLPYDGDEIPESFQSATDEAYAEGKRLLEQRLSQSIEASRGLLELCQDG